MRLALDPVPPIPAATLLVLLTELGVLLGLALLLGRLAVRLRMPAVVGELLAGVLLGPSVLGNLAPAVSGWLFPQHAEQFHVLDGIAQVGVLLLVGFTGLQMDTGLLRRRGLTAVRVSVAGLVLPVGLGVAAGFLLAPTLSGPGTAPGVFALFMAVAMGVTAIPVVSKILSDMGLLHRDVGQLTLVAAMIDDAIGWLMLSVVAALAAGGLHPETVLLSTGSLLLALGLALGAVPVVRLARRIATAPNRTWHVGSLPAAAVVIVMLAAAGTQALGLEAILGAFLAGLCIRASGAELSRLTPLHTVVMSVLAPLFFATAGLRVDLTGLADPAVLLAGLTVVAVAIAGKFAGAFVGALASRMSRWEALALGAGMNARGIIGIVVAMVGLRLGVLNANAYTIIVLMAIVTSLMAPPILRRAMSHVDSTTEERLRERLLALDEPEQPRNVGDR